MCANVVKKGQSERVQAGFFSLCLSYAHQYSACHLFYFPVLETFFLLPLSRSLALFFIRKREHFVPGANHTMNDGCVCKKQRNGKYRFFMLSLLFCEYARTYERYMRFKRKICCVCCICIFINFNYFQKVVYTFSTQAQYCCTNLRMV